MTYNLRFSHDATKELKKLDKFTAKLILDWLYVNVDNTENPREHGKGLTANLSGYWRYRIGNYRVICKIYDNELVVEAIKVGHRRDIYD